MKRLLCLPMRLMLLMPTALAQSTDSTVPVADLMRFLITAEELFPTESPASTEKTVPTP